MTGSVGVVASGAGSSVVVGVVVVEVSGVVVCFSSSAALELEPEPPNSVVRLEDVATEESPKTSSVPVSITPTSTKATRPVAMASRARRRGMRSGVRSRPPGSRPGRCTRRSPAQRCRRTAVATAGGARVVGRAGLGEVALAQAAPSFGHRVEARRPRRAHRGHGACRAMQALAHERHDDGRGGRSDQRPPAPDPRDEQGRRE